MDPSIRLAEVEALLRQLNDDAGDASLTEDQQSQWDALDAERADLARQIEAREARRAQVATFAAQPANRDSGDGATGAPEVMRRVNPFENVDVRSMPRAEARDRALAALDQPELVGHLEDSQKVRLAKMLRTQSRNLDGSHLARRLLVTESPSYRSAFMKVASNPTPNLNYEESRAVEAFNEFRAMALDPTSAGGFGVPILIDPTIILTAQGHPNDFFAISRVEVITNDEWRGVSSAGVTWSFDPEATAVSDDSPTLAQPTVPAHKAQGFIPYSIEIGMDYPGFASEMSRLLASGYSELLVSSFTNGTGTNQPTGIVSALAANTNVLVLPGTDGAFSAPDIYNLWAQLPIRYRNPAAWMSSQDVQNEVRQFASGSSPRVDANFTVDLTQEEIPRMFGKRYYVNDYMPLFTATTGSANIIIVGDWVNFLIAQRAGMTVELVPHLFDVTNNRPTGQRGWYAWARVGSDSVNDLGFRMLQNS
jgi:HK97 family phage major capsid protein